MYSFGTKSRKNLESCHPKLQFLFGEVIKHVDCSVICGERTEEEQNKAFKENRSKLKFPESKHNSTPSLAVDVVPYPIDWTDMERFQRFVFFVKGMASAYNINLRVGLDWDGNFKLDENFVDAPHFEITN